MRRHGCSGQYLVELALLLPLMLSIVAGGYALCRTGFLRSSCASLAQAVNLRAGRRQLLSEETLGKARPADLCRHTRKTSAAKTDGPFPVMPPGLSGRTTSEIRWEKPWVETGGYGMERSAEIVQTATAHVDCWDAGSSSGKNVRTYVNVFVVGSILR